MNELRPLCEVLKSRSGGCLVTSELIPSAKLQKKAIFLEKIKNLGIYRKIPLGIVIKKLRTKSERAAIMEKYQKVGRMGFWRQRKLFQITNYEKTPFFQEKLKILELSG